MPECTYTVPPLKAPERSSPQLLGDKQKSPSKTRRSKGEGNGSIYWRKVTKNGKDYHQAYYHWKENGRKRTKYIPCSKLKEVQLAEEQKRPVVEILQLLGVIGSTAPGEDRCKPQVLGDTEKSPSKTVSGDPEKSPSKSLSKFLFPSKRRIKGNGSGYIYRRSVTKNGNTYQQAYYHYEEWSNGDRLIKSTKYIPKRLLTKVSDLDKKKVPVREILQILGVKLD